MRTWIVTAAAAVMLGITLPAAAADLNEKQPEMKAYLTFNFDGRGADAQQLNYGLRMDHDRRFLEAPRPAIAQLEFRTGAGFDSFQLNGAPLVQRQAELNQDGEVQYSWVDWSLVAAAVVGIGWIAYETFDNGESKSPPPAEQPGAPVTPQSPLDDLLGVLPPALTDALAPLTDALGSAPVVGDLLNALAGGGGGLSPDQLSALTDALAGLGLPIPSAPGYAALRNRPEIERHSPAYQAWLDGGTGHMGDLAATH
ncbi:MAG TPA: hypothetical protein VLI06_13575 [Solimonas sp.]|nr:hypothetical protein [Solimonas sp.]